MKKSALIALAIVLSATLMSNSALANNGGHDEKGNSASVRAMAELKGHPNFGQFRSAFAHSINRLRQEFKGEDRQEKHNMIIGGAVRVTALSGGDEITAEGLGKSNKDFTINTDSNTDFFLKNGDDANFNDIDVGDTIIFSGTITDKNDEDITVDASKVRIFGDVDFTARAKVTGEVTDVNSGDDQLTIETDDNQTITINTDDFTTIKDEDGDKIDLSDLSAGMNIRIKGFWNSLMNAIVAIKIKILE